MIPDTFKKIAKIKGTEQQEEWARSYKATEGQQLHFDCYQLSVFFNPKFPEECDQHIFNY